MDWLQQGSRELFGTVIENKIYILVDTSGSMEPHMQFVKDKLFILMQVCKFVGFYSWLLAITYHQ